MAEILEAAPAAAPDALEFNTTFQGQKLVLRVKRDGVVADLLDGCRASSIIWVGVLGTQITGIMCSIAIAVELIGIVVVWASVDIIANTIIIDILGVVSAVIGIGNKWTQITGIACSV